MNIGSTILNLIFPLKCISCGKSGSDFCNLCLALAPSAERESANWIFPIFDYRHPPVKKAIKLMKYKNKRRIANTFAEVMYGRIIEELAELSVMENFREPILIPIPLSRKRYKERGYNQSELLCKKLMELNKNNFNFTKDSLIKIKETEHQAQIENRVKRLKNIVGSFAVLREEKIRGRNIILIDDVTTTGATLTEAKKTLKKAGARKIIAFTIAH